MFAVIVEVEKLLIISLGRHDILDVDRFLLLPQEAQVVRHQVQEDHLHSQELFQIKRLVSIFFSDK